MIKLGAYLSPDETEVRLQIGTDDDGSEPFDVTMDAASLLAFIESLIEIREQMKPSIADDLKAKGH